MRLRTGRSLLLPMLAVLVAVAVVGCTRIGLVYNRLDALMHLQLGRYVDLDAQQDKDLDTRFDVLWRWHRRSQLPLYAQDVREVEPLIAKPLSLAQLQILADRTRQRTQVSVVEALRAATPVLVSFSDAQVQSMTAELEKRAAKEKRKQQKLSAAEWVEQREEMAADRLQEWAGSVSPAQRERLHQWAFASERPPLDPRAQQRREFATLLRDRHAADFARRFEAYGLQAFSEEAMAKQAPQRQLTRQLLVDLSRLATPAQRAYLKDKLTAMAVELDTLSQAPPSR